MTTPLLLGLALGPAGLGAAFHGGDDGGAAPPATTHWAYVAPERPEPPAHLAAPWTRNPIDAFVLARLEREGLAPSPEADRATLIRRVSLDLLGLPPTLAELDAFLADTRPDAYERLVERLLASPRYGERRAQKWLDLARYADTHGYEKDQRRTMWPYRDWVIRAFNDDLPFDRFTSEQLAGDLLPDATLDQEIATGFHRNTMVNEEGGVDSEEFRVAAVVDRVNTTGEVWLGTTLGCVQCHDHKYDPFTQREYYELFAFFDNTEDTGSAAAPVVRAPTPEQRSELARLAFERALLQARLDGPWPELEAQQRGWEEAQRARLAPPPSWKPVEVVGAFSEQGAKLELLDDGSLLAGGVHPAADVYVLTARAPAAPITGLRLEALRHDSLPAGGPGRAGDGNFVLGELHAQLFDPTDLAQSVDLAFASARADHDQPGFRVARAIDGDPRTGWAIGGAEPAAREAWFALREPVRVAEGSMLRVRLEFRVLDGFALGRLRLSVAGDESLLIEAREIELGPWSAIGPFAAQSGRAGHDTAYGPERAFAEGRVLASAYDGLEWSVREDWTDGGAHDLGEVVGATYLYREVESTGARPVQLLFGSDDSIRVWHDGALALDVFVERGVAPEQERVPLELHAGRNGILVKVVNQGGPGGFSFDLALRADGEPGPALCRALFAAAPTEEERRPLREHFRARVSPEGREVAAKLAELDARRAAVESAVPEAMVLREREERRTTHVLARGSFLSPGEAVEPGVPAALGTLPDRAEGVESRLALARWLVSPANPLTARVAVNRLWEELFGAGIVETSEDFGTRGAPPSHPELLDWLAVELVERGWSVKELLKLIVTSATYRQSSDVDPARLERDPRNRLLARGARLRMDIETVRDTVLAVAGLLGEKIGGPSVFPPQPEGVWTMTYSGDQWTAASDEDRWRRGLYTFWRRTAPYPTFAIFDAPSRELTCARRPRTNTPLQALALLNDPAFFEAAIALGARMLREGGASAEARARHGFRLCLARDPDAAELALLAELQRTELAAFSERPGEAEALLRTDAPIDVAGVDPVELAAWTMVANVLLNLDETITKG